MERNTERDSHKGNEISGVRQIEEKEIEREDTQRTKPGRERCRGKIEKDIVNKDRQTQNRDRSDNERGPQLLPLSDERVNQVMAWLLSSSHIPYIWKLLVLIQTSNKFNLLYV